MRLTVCALSLAVAASGCAESVLIKSYPVGSKAYVDDEFIGSTPTYTTIPRSEVGPGHRWRVEYRNCDPAEGELTTGVGAGRVVGYIFTLGISAAFIGPNYFKDVDANLSGGDCETSGTVKAKAPAGITVQQIVGDGNVSTSGGEATSTQKLAERLETLRDLHNKKLIPKEVYESESQKAVDELMK